MVHGCALLHPSQADGVEIDTAWDPVTEITLVHTEVALGDLTRARPTIEATMQSLMIHLGVDEITDAVAAEASRSGR